MKRVPLLMLGLNCGLFLVLWAALDFKTTHEINFTKIKTEKRTLQTHIKVLEDDLDFLKTHQNELDFLAEKGWFIPKSRLIAGDVLEKMHSSLTDVQYTFEPETVKSFGKEHPFKMTKIIMKGGAPLDTDIYEFIELLLKEFPGILKSQELILAKGDSPNLIEGKFVFEWVSMEQKANED